MVFFIKERGVPPVVSHLKNTMPEVRNVFNIYAHAFSTARILNIRRIVSAFNEHFINVGHSLADKFKVKPTDDPVQYLPVSKLNKISKYETRRINDLQVPKPRLEISKKSFSYVGTKVWNDIPNDIRNVESTHLFKQKMKTYLFGQ